MLGHMLVFFLFLILLDLLSLLSVKALGKMSRFMVQAMRVQLEVLPKLSHRSWSRARKTVQLKGRGCQAGRQMVLVWLALVFVQVTWMCFLFGDLFQTQMLTPHNHPPQLSQARVRKPRFTVRVSAPLPTHSSGSSIRDAGVHSTTHAADGSRASVAVGAASLKFQTLMWLLKVPLCVATFFS